MTWADDFFEGTNSTNTTNLPDVVKKYYDKRFLRVTANHLRIIPMGQMKPIPMGTGVAIEFTRYLNITVSVSGATLTESLNPVATILKAQKITATVLEYGAFSQISSLLIKASIDQGFTRIADLWSEHAATLLDTLAHREVASSGHYPMRADGVEDVDFFLDSTIGTVPSTTTFTIADADQGVSNLGNADDDYNQSIAIITGGDAYGQARPITDYVAATETFTISPAWDKALSVADPIRIVSYHDLVAADDLTYINVKRARTQLKRNRAPMWEGNSYVLVAGPEQIENFADDVNWINAHTYKDGAELFNGEIGKMFGIRFVEETDEFRFPSQTAAAAASGFGPGAEGANQSATGAGELVFVFGQESFGVTTFKGQSGELGEPMRIKRSGPGDTSNPLDRFATVGWEREAKYKALNPMFCVGIACGAK